jgi:hypothetical protein
LGYAEQAGSEQPVAVVRAAIANILYRHCDLDEALRIHQEQLPVHQRDGDVRATAITWGQIAETCKHGAGSYGSKPSATRCSSPTPTSPERADQPRRRAKGLRAAAAGDGAASASLKT